jgi:small subunit ribosomal protein S5
MSLEDELEETPAEENLTEENSPEESSVQEKAEIETAKEAEIQEEVEIETAKEEEIQEEVEVLPADKRGRRRKQRDRYEEEKPQSEWIERVVQIRRVTKVVKGGKKLSFRAIVIVGNKKGQVGVGCAKASEVIIAIQKAIADGRKNLITVPIFKTTIPHPVTGRSGAGSVMLRPASQGTGIIAGGAVRLVLELAGIENILSKSLGSKSPLNAANATLEALKSLTPFSEVAKRRGLTVAELLN